jgi:hypothetical protein
VLDRVTIIMTVGPLVLLLWVLEMVRRKRLREDYSLLWMATAIVLVVLALWRESLEIVAKAMGIFYPPTALFVVGIGFLLLILLQFSTVITRLARENKQAAQHIALLNQRLRALEAQVEDPPGALR